MQHEVLMTRPCCSLSLSQLPGPATCDFTSIEMMMEWDQPPNIVNVLVFCDHLIKHIVHM